MTMTGSIAAIVSSSERYSQIVFDSFSERRSKMFFTDSGEGKSGADMFFLFSIGISFARVDCYGKLVC